MNQNEENFEQQVRAHKATIYTVCYMFSKDQDEVADLYQECLINLWRSWPNFEHRSDVRTWIYRICLNVCVSLERKMRRHKTIPLTMDINPYEEDNQNSRQMEMLRQRINAVAGEHKLRRDWRHRGHLGQERQRAPGAHQGTTEKNEIDSRNVGSGTTPYY